MNLLVLYQAQDPQKDQPGYFDGFERLVGHGLLSSHQAIPYYGVAKERGWDALWEEAADAARRIEADAVFLQFFHGSIPGPAAGIQRLKSLPSRPLIFTSLGDPFGRYTKRVPSSYRIASSLADVNFLTGMGYLADQLYNAGSRNLVLMPNGCCQVRFAADPDQPGRTDEFDVVFIGNRVGSRNPASHYFWVGKKREALIAKFTRNYGKRFGLFGKSWEGNPSWQGPVPYHLQQATYWRSAVALGGLPNGYHDYYTSDRAFIGAGSGTPFVDFHVNGVEAILEPEHEWWLAGDVPGLLQCCDKLLSCSQSVRREIGSTARARIMSKHTQADRCRQMMQIVKDIRAARSRNQPAAEPRLEFLSTRPPRIQLPPAVVAWQG